MPTAITVLQPPTAMLPSARPRAETAMQRPTRLELQVASPVRATETQESGP